MHFSWSQQVFHAYILHSTTHYSLFSFALLYFTWGEMSSVSTAVSWHSIYQTAAEAAAAELQLWRTVGGTECCWGACRLQRYLHLEPTRIGTNTCKSKNTRDCSQQSRVFLDLHVFVLMENDFESSRIPSFQREFHLESKISNIRMNVKWRWNVNDYGLKNNATNFYYSRQESNLQPDPLPKLPLTVRITSLK